MKYLKYIFICMLGIVFGGCSDAIAPENRASNEDVRIVGDKILLSTSVDMSDFKEVSTRAFSDAPNLNDLNLYIVEFVDNGDPLINTLSAVYRPSREVVDAERRVVKYDVTINKTDQPRILHFLALADDNLQIPNGVESSVMPGLTSTESQDAYWRRLEFKRGYCTRETYDGNKERWVINQDLKDKLVGDGTSGPKNVKLVRNFCKVTVGIEDSAAGEGEGKFTLEDFILVNIPLKGTMVPYASRGAKFPEFLDANGNPLAYETVAASYSGISPANTNLGNEVTSEDAPKMGIEDLTTVSDGTKTLKCLPSEYMYERPFNSISRTYIIVKGIYHNRITNPRNESSYYKLDLGKNDTNGIFRYMGLLRNFNYFIRITEVAASGYGSASEAAWGTVYNNISFDIDTDHLMNMSDGTDIVRVNFTTAVITANNYTLDFKYAYKEEIRNSTNGTYNNDAATVIGLVPGDVIASVTQTSPGTSGVNPADPWRTYQITFKNPTAITKTQEFTVVNKNTGLGRNITLVSHLKWDFENLREFARIWENYPSTYKGLQTYNPDNTSERNPHENSGYANGTENSTYEGLCGTDVGSQFTIFFDIPDNIPEALFPLEFTIESLTQGLENEPMGTIVVAPGPTLFPDQNGVGENRIQYVKSVTWTEYNAPLHTDVRDDNGTRIGDPEDGPVIHRVRCRFRTIETVAENSDAANVTVRIANTNFNTGEVKFRRTNAANNLRGPGLTGTPN